MLFHFIISHYTGELYAHGLTKIDSRCLPADLLITDVCWIFHFLLTEFPSTWKPRASLTGAIFAGFKRSHRYVTVSARNTMTSQKYSSRVVRWRDFFLVVVTFFASLDLCLIKNDFVKYQMIKKNMFMFKMLK